MTVFVVKMSIECISMWAWCQCKKCVTWARLDIYFATLTYRRRETINNNENGFINHWTNTTTIVKGKKSNSRKKT